MKRIKICPKCGSTNITFTGIRTNYDYCKDCGYGKNYHLENALFPEIDPENVEDFRKEVKISIPNKSP